VWSNLIIITVIDHIEISGPPALASYLLTINSQWEHLAQTLLYQSSSLASGSPQGCRLGARLVQQRFYHPLNPDFDLIDPACGYPGNTPQLPIALQDRDVSPNSILTQSLAWPKSACRACAVQTITRNMHTLRHAPYDWMFSYHSSQRVHDKLRPLLYHSNDPRIVSSRLFCPHASSTRCR
jgi:hypothetical protein